MRVVIARTMPNFSMDVYADSIVSGLKTVRPNWDIVELAPHPIDRSSRSLLLRGQKFYERFWGFPRTVEQRAADIFHIIDHSEGHIVNWLKNTGKPVVVTCHDLINLFYSDNLQGSLKIPIISNGMWLRSVKAMRHADHIVAVSSVTAKDTSNILKIEPKRITVVPNTIDPIFQPLPQHEVKSFRQQQGILPETLCLLNVGGNHPRKNISTIIKALLILKEKGLPFKFWKAGSDFTDEQKQFIQKYQLANYINYLGQPNKSLLVKIYNAADILLAPSLHEGFGITLIEAMACGTPVITSNTSAMPEVVGDAGILVSPTDCHAIVESVFHLYRDSTSYQELVYKGLARIKLFTRENTGEQIAQIYESIIKQSIKRP
jgi:glycosyltransferase involved in cell wall biosynthesis